MFIRKTHRPIKKMGKTYTYFSIVATERIETTTRQNTLITLGSNFDLPEEKLPILCKKI
jgi:hypothetical protein